MSRLAQLGKALRGQRGYTIVELIAAMSIFSVILIVTIGAFVSVHRTSQKSAAARRVQQDVRYNLEQMAREIRSSSINYQFYASNNNPACTLDNHRVLALILVQADANNNPTAPQQIFYHFTGNAIYRVNTPGNCAAVLGDTGNRITDQNNRVNSLQFFISPTADPNDPNSPPRVRAIQPRVTILWDEQTGTLNRAGQPDYNHLQLETTISSRSYNLSVPVGQPG